MTRKPSILIADDHPLVLKGLHDFLDEKSFNVIARASNGKQALNLIKAHQPDIAILDILMPFYSGLEIAEKCTAENYPTKVILITLEKDELIYKKAKALNIFGYVLKEFALDEIENCINAVTLNKRYFSPQLIKALQTREGIEILDQFTNTELKIIQLIARNNTAKDIADILKCSRRTVEKHKSNIIKKLELEPYPNSLLIWTKEHQSLFQ